jgi:hypothetical protein
MLTAVATPSQHPPLSHALPAIRCVVARKYPAVPPVPLDCTSVLLFSPAVQAGLQASTSTEAEAGGTLVKSSPLAAPDIEASATLLRIGGVTFPVKPPSHPELVPRPLFVDIASHRSLLRDCLDDVVSGQHLLLIGNQGPPQISTPPSPHMCGTVWTARTLVHPLSLSFAPLLFPTPWFVPRWLHCWAGVPPSASGVGKNKIADKLLQLMQVCVSLSRNGVVV